MRARGKFVGVGAAVTVAAALSLSPAARAADTPANVPGGPLYQKLCSQCHGEKGDGQGVAALRLMPRPRDFTAGKFKIRHTPSGSLPTDEDLTHVIREGMPYTSMPAWKQLSDEEIKTLVAAVKSFSPDFADAAKKPKAIEIPKAPASSADSIKKGKEVYAKIGCASCHGEVGRGDGTSAPTLKDDWNHPIRPADLTMRWTFRGGPTREDIYRTFTTGLNGTPMPSFAESLTDAERWQLVDYIASLDPRDAPGYSNLLQVQWSNEELDLAKAKELFATAPPALFPVIGQVTEPGRAFHPSASAVEVRAVYNAREIAFRVTWHDLRADTVGHNAPDLVVPPEEEQAAEAAEATAAEAGGDVWGVEEAAATPAAEPAASGGDVWGDEAEAAPGAPAAVTPDTEFSDALAIQLPVTLPTGIRKPYFIFGDSQNPVDLWFIDLASKAVQRYTGAGSSSVTVVEGEDVTAIASYDHGEWSVVMKRALRGSGSVSFEPGQFVPVAFSVWDGYDRERGSKRGLTQWMYLYTMPQEAPSPIGPMIEAALAVLVVEIFLVLWVRRRQRVSQNGEVQAHV
ncbi:MAG TPA: c-type cytochrome [Thermoanaerobaculia bacterium]|nr:c-type cytochrome [Thermoanaerobaculia bacterium]